MKNSAKNSGKSVVVATTNEAETVNSVVVAVVAKTPEQITEQAHKLVIASALSNNLKRIKLIHSIAKKLLKIAKLEKKQAKSESKKREEKKAEDDAIVQQMISSLKIGDAILVKKYRSEETFEATYSGITISNGYIRCKYKVGNKSDWSAFTNVIIPAVSEVVAE